MAFLAFLASKQFLVFKKSRHLPTALWAFAHFSAAVHKTKIKSLHQELSRCNLQHATVTICTKIMQTASSICCVSGSVSHPSHSLGNEYWKAFFVCHIFGIFNISATSTDLKWIQTPRSLFRHFGADKTGGVSAFLKHWKWIGYGLIHLKYL